MSKHKYRTGKTIRYQFPKAVSGALVLSLLISLSANSANLAGYTLDHVGSDYGLPQSSVRAIAQDPSGFLWVGTESGLHRFDGTQFDLFEPPFGHGVVNSIAIDARGRVWTSWFTKPTTLYDPVERQWTTLDVLPPRTLPLGFLEDPSGRVWLSDGSTLYGYDEQSGESLPLLGLEYETGSVVSQDLVWDDGTIWLPSASGVLGYDTKTGQISSASLRNVDPAVALLNAGGNVWSCHRHRVYKKQPGESFEIYYENAEIVIRSCAHDAAGQLWIGTLDDGALKIRSANEVRYYKHDPKDQASIASNQVEKIFQDESGRLWLVSPNEVSLYDNTQFIEYTYDSGGAGTNFSRLIDLQIIEDRSGVIWLGTAGDGLARLSRYSRKFRSAIPPANDTRSKKSVMDSFGNLWIGMKRDGVYRWNRSRNTWTHYRADINDASKLPTTEVRALLATTTNEIYAGSEVGILNRYDGDIDGWNRIEIGGSEPIHNLLEIPDHRLVIGRNRLLSVFDPATSTIRNFQLGENAKVQAITLSKSGRVWVGTNNAPGLLEFDPNLGVARDWSDLFATINVISLHEDKTGIVWVGTWGNGLIRFNPQSRRTQSISIDDGLTAHTIMGILPGAQNDIWISSDRGLTRIQNCASSADTCEPQVTKYDESDGLANKWFGANSYSASSNGELFVGGSNGIDFFHPSLFEENRIAPKVSLIDVSLNGEAITGRTNVHRRYSLPYEFGELEIRFAATDFHDPAKNQYQYRMNSQSAWVSLENLNRITLRNLQPGTHELEIAGSNNDGVWSLEPIMLTIAVASPVYFRWWAIVAYCLLAASLLFAVNRYRERRNQAYTMMLEQEVEERTADLSKANRAMAEFYANVSHEVRTPLALIFSAVDRLQDAVEARDAGSVISAIRRHTRSLSRYVDGLITVSQLNSSSELQWRAADASAYLEQLTEDFQPLAGTRQVFLRPPKEGPLLVRTQSNALNTIFSNLIINAIKHAKEGGVIRVSADSEPPFAQFTIEDDGPGIAPEIREKIFDRGALYSNVSGYGIGLHLVRQAAIALGGDVIAEDSDLGGACFRITIPLADESLPLVRSIGADGPLEIDSPELATAINTPANNGAKPSILIIEDNEELRQNVGQYLSETFHVLESATVEGSLKIAADEVPDIVLCDVLLPDGSGFEVVRQIKSDLITDHIPVVVMTALADEENRIKGLEHRADTYLTKPFQRSVLEATLDNLIRDRRNVLRHAALLVWNDNWNEPSVRRGSEQDFTRRFMAALEACYSDHSSDVKTLAGKLAMSRRALERKTKQYLVRSPNELLTEFRLQHAMRLLQAGWRIIDVSTACGFGNTSHFGAVFRKRFNCTPSDYAKRHSKGA